MTGRHAGRRRAGPDRLRRRHGGQDVFGAWTVTGDRSARTASVTVTGTAVGLLPGLRLPVRQSATVPVERLTR